MARTGRTYQSKREPAHMASEASRLREMVQEREEEIDRLRAEIRGAYTMLDRYAGDVSDEAYHEIESCLIGALDGGGGDDE